MENKKKSIITNLSYDAVSKFVAIVCPLLTAPYLSRCFGTETIGLTGYVSSIIAMFCFVSALGSGAYGQREVATTKNKTEASEVFWGIMLSKVLVGAITIVAFSCFVLWYGNHQELLVIAGTTLLATIFDVSWFYYGLEEFKIVSLRNISVRVISTLLVFVLVDGKEDVFLYVAICAATEILTTAIMVVSIRKRLTRISVKNINLGVCIKGMLIFFAPALAVKLYSEIDRIMLGSLLKSTVENGYYEQAKKIITIFVELIITINAVMMPRISRLMSEDKKTEVKRYYQDTFRCIIMLVMPISVGLLCVSGNFVPCFFGEGYDKTIGLLQISGLLITFMCIGNFVGTQYLLPMGMQKKSTIIYTFSCVINIILNALLIPIMGSYGAMIASLCAELISCVWQILIIVKSEYRFKMSINIWKPVVATACMGGVVQVVYAIGFQNGVLSLVLKVFLGAITYVVVLVALKDSYILAVLERIKKRK